MSNTIITKEAYPLRTDEKTHPLMLVYAETVQARPAEQYRRNNWAYWTFEYVSGGSGFVKNYHQQWKLSIGDAYVLQENGSYHYGASRNSPWSKKFFVLHGWLVGQLWQAYSLEKCTVIKQCGLIKFFDKMLELRNTNPPNIHQQAALIFHEMLIAISSSNTSELGLYSPIVQKALNYINRNIEKPVNIDNIAAAADSSPAHLTRIFKAETNLTPYACLLAKRMTLAKRLLKGTTMPIKEIAARLQYADAYYFSNAFKKHNKLSPVAWRKKVLSSL